MAEITQLVGYNLLNPDNLPEVGLDPRKAFGLAWLGEGDEGVLFASIIDHDKFQTSVYRTASKLGTALVPEVIGDSLIIRPRRPSEWQLVIRGENALLVLSDDGERKRAGELARAIAEIEIDASLAGNPEFAVAMTDLRFGRDLAGYSVLGPSLGGLSQLLGIDRTLSLAFGVEIDSGAVRVKGFVPMAEGTMLRRVLRNSDRRSALVAATERQPLLLLATNVDSAELSASPLAPVIGEGLEVLGISPETDLTSIVSGEMGIAVVRTGNLTLGRDPAAALGVNVAVELSDPEGAARILIDAMNSPAMAELVRPGAPGQYTVAVAGWNDLHVGITGGYFYASSQPGFRDRLTAAVQQLDAKKPSSADVQSPLDREIDELFTRGAALRAAIHMVVFSYFLMPVYGDLNTAIALPDAYALGSLEPADDVPYSDEYKAIEKQLEEARAEAQRLGAEAVKQEIKRQIALAEAFGTSAWRVDVESSGLAIFGGQFFGQGGLRGALDAVIQELNRSGADSIDTYTADMRVRQLEEELVAIRTGDIVEYRRTGQVGGSEISSTDGLDKNIVRRYVRRNLQQIKQCYETELAQGNVDTVTVQTEFTIGGNGRVLEATAAGGTEKMNACIVKALESIRFPTPKGRTVVKVNYPFTFRPS